jgi:hypothetical protein
MMTPWSEEENDFLRRLAAARHSGAEISAQLEEIFGSKRSRSAVLGRAMRLGVSINSDLASRGVAKKAKAPAGKTASQARHMHAPAPAAAETPASSLPALRPPERQKHNSHNIRVKATRHLDERFDEIRTARLAEVAAFEAKLAENGDVNPGVLFLERDMTKHCAAPMAGWDAAPIYEKRVCGAPVEWRIVNIGETTSAQPTSWCEACRKRFTVSASDKRADLTKLASLDKSVRRAA